MYHIHCSWLFVVLTIPWQACVGSHTNSSGNLLLDRLTKSCPTDGIPVCGVRDKQFVLFSNGCLLNAANKDKLQSEKNVKRVPLKYCLAGCQLACPKRRQPVCARNVKTYQTQMFDNQCELVKHICKTNKDWRIVNLGMCPEDYLKSRRHLNKRHLIVKRSFHNNLYNQIEEYNANRFVSNKGELSVAPNDVFVYMQPELRTQFLSHDASSYQQQPVPEHKAYDEILNKIAKLSPADIAFPVEEDKTVIENSLLERSTIDPLAFAVNRLNVNYLGDQNLDLGIDRPPYPPARDTFTDGDKKEYYYEFAKIDRSIETEDSGEIPIADDSLSSETTPALETSTTDSNAANEEGSGKKSIECKFGTAKICAALADGSVRTFETICEMMTANVYFKNTWTKLHEGSCEDCKHNCSRDYQPVCASRNGVNYTMVNECYYNMAICMDKKSKWQKLSDKECERYTRIPDRYSNSKPGFPYTSNYFVSSTTPIPNTTTSTSTEKGNVTKNKKRRPNFKRAVEGVPRSHNCCPESHITSETGNNIKCECEEKTTPVPSTTESHIMSLVKETDKEE